MPLTHRILPAALLALVLLAGAALRFDGLGGRGLLFWDEGENLCEARFFAGAVRCIPTALHYGWLQWFGGAATAPQRAALRAEMEARTAGGRYPRVARNTHALLVGTLFLLLGDADWVGNAQGAVFGLLTLALVAWVTQSLYGTRAAVVATLALALCPLHVLLSRGSLAETDAIFFLVAALALARAARHGARAPLRLLALAGLAAGLSFTCNKRFLVAPLALWTLLGIETTTADHPLAGRRARAFAVLSGSMFLPLLAWEASYWLSFLVLGEPLWHDHSTYFPRLFQSVTVLGVPAFGAGDPASLPFFLGEYVGWAIVVLAAAGLVREALRRGRDGLYLAVPLAWTLFFFQLRSREQCLRYLGPALPFLCVAAGAALREAADLSRLARWCHRALPFAAAAALLATLPADAEWRRDRSGMAEAFAWLRAQRAAGGGGAYYCADLRIAQYYDPPGTAALEIPGNRAELEQGVRAGARYFVVTPTLLLLAPERGWDWPVTQLLAGHVRPVEVAHPGGTLAWLAYEHNLYAWASLDETRRRADELARTGGTIRIYDLRPALDPPTGDGSKK